MSHAHIARCELSLALTTARHLHEAPTRAALRSRTAESTQAAMKAHGAALQAGEAALAAAALDLLGQLDCLAYDAITA